MDLVHQKKGATPPNVYRQQYLDIRNQYSQHSPIFTDCAKVENCIATAMVTGQQSYGVSLPEKCSIFTAEARALL